MQKQRHKILTHKAPRFIPLKYRFIIISSILLIVLLGVIALIVSIYQSRTMRTMVERRGIAIAESLSATSKAALATYNYIALEQTVNQAAQDPDILYVIIHDKEGRVAGYSRRPELQGRFLSDPITEKALSASAASLIQRGVWGPQRIPVLDVSVAVFLPGSELRWGTIRVGISLQPMYRQIHQIWLIIALLGLVALSIGVLLSIWAASRITRPLDALVQATVQAAQGNLEQHIEIRTRDEIETLADNFNVMTREILAQRDQLELQLREIGRLQSYTEQLLTAMSDGLLSVDGMGKIATMNPAACSMAGVDRDETKELFISNLYDQTPALARYIDNLLENPWSHSQEEIHIEKDIHAQVILASSSVLTDAERNFSELIVNLHDITDLKRLESRVRQSERLAALGTLAAGMAHEIRNPLSAIKTFVQLLPRKLERPGFLDKFNRTVPRELDRINRLIEDLLQLAREPKYYFAPVSVRTLLEQCMELFEEDLKRVQINCRLVFAQQDSAPILADSDQLTKAFHNLVQNAVQAMPNGGELVVEAERRETIPFEATMTSDQKGWLQIFFKDTGVGISAEDITNIFNPFFTTKDTGTGLGLAITHKVITEHGGQIEVRKRNGEGTCFIIYLPALKP